MQAHGEAEPIAGRAFRDALREQQRRKELVRPRLASRIASCEDYVELQHQASVLRWHGSKHLNAALPELDWLSPCCGTRASACSGCT